MLWSTFTLHYFYIISFTGTLALVCQIINGSGCHFRLVYLSAFCFQASTPYSLESESLRMDCIMSGGVSPTLAINAVTNKVL